MTSIDRWNRIREARPGAAYFFYRESPRKLVAVNRDAAVTRNDPPADVPGMVRDALERQGYDGVHLSGRCPGREATSP